MGRIFVAGLAVAALWAGVAVAAPAKTYSAREGGESVSVQVNQDAGGAHMAVTRSGANGCALKVEGPARMEGGAYHMVADSAGKACDVKLTPKPAYAELLENKCEAHGDECRLDDLPILQAH